VTDAVLAEQPGTRRSLVVAAATPWGEAAGFRLRLQMVVEGLGRLGPVDLCVVHHTRPAELDAPPSTDIADAVWLPVAGVSLWRWRLLWSGVTPERLSRLAPVPARELEVVRGDHSLTWCVDSRGFAPVRALVTRPVVLDLLNLHDWMVRHQMSSPYQSRFRRAVYLPRLASKWKAWQQAAAREVDAVAVCSELDADRLGVGNAVVVPNAYLQPPAPAARRALRSDPDRLALALVGTMQYDPNRLGARYFANTVLPLIRRQVPGATFEVIGSHPHLVDELRTIAGVRVRGHVADIGAALNDVDVLVAPIFFGGGTRLKILEGFARRIPVVSTTVGAEGLDVRDGEHLLVADTPDGFAGAVTRVHRSPELRNGLIDRAEQLFQANYTWARGVDTVERLARRLVDATPGDHRDRYWYRA
jgi:glycosyltransferase involved in cell wall biosynthesis